MKVHAKLLAATLAAVLLSAAQVEAKDTVPNLGGGLDELTTATANKSLLRAAAPELAAVHPMTFDDAGRVLVRISLDGKVPGASFLQGVRSTAGIEVAASDLSYRAGVIEAYVPTNALRSLARKAGVLAVVPSSPMVTNVGAAQSQGVVQHRVDRIKGVDGKGITVGVMSDSFDKAPGDIRAADDVATGDLPGPGNPFGNTQPVVVFEDWEPAATDEGRAMAQIVHDLAPKARLGFATANGTELNMADNIRSLAGLPNGSKTIPGFKADIIVDDIVYYTEPFFQDGIIAQAVDEVAAAGVHYFSSAGNRPATMGYDSKLRIVPASEATNSGLNFANVPPELYAGGFHNFDEGSSVDISQTVQIGGGSRIVMQWNEPYDPAPPTPVGPPLAAGTGTVPAGGDTQFTFQGTAGAVVQIFADADNTTTGTPNPDLTLEVFDPNGQSILFVDNGTNPESAIQELPLNGTYTVVVDSFQPDQFGDFLYRVQQVSIEERVLTDYNLLFFLRQFRLRQRGAEPLDQSSGGVHSAAGRAVPDRHCAFQHAACEQSQRRGSHPLRRLHRRATAGALQLPRSDHLRTQLGERRQRSGGIRRVRTVRAGAVHVAWPVDDLFRQEQQAPEASRDPAEAGHGRDGWRQQHVLQRRRSRGR